MHIKKLIVLKCLVLIVAHVSLGQNTFSRVYDFEYGSDLGGDLIIEDSTIFTVSSGSDVRVGGLYSLKLLKIDKEGNELWRKVYRKPYTQYTLTGAGTLIQDVTGNYYIAVTIIDSVNADDLMIAKVNSIGDSIWFNSIGGRNRDVLYALNYDSVSQKIYAVGGSESSGPGGASEVMWCIDTSGQTHFVKYYGGSGYDYAVSMAREEDTIWVGGFTDSYQPGLQASLIKLDTAGNLIDRYDFGTNGYEGDGLVDKRDSILIIAATFDTINIRWGVPTISKLNSSGEVLWRKYFTNGQVQGIRKVKILQDGSILFGGQMCKGDGICGGWIGKISSSGQVMWGRFYTHYEPYPNYGTTGSFYSFDYDTSLQAIYCIGEVGGNPQDSFRTNQDVWLLKLDSMGCLIPGCDTLTTTGAELVVSNDDPQAFLFPNPTSAQAMVVVNGGPKNEGVSFELYNLAGQQVHTQTEQLNSYGYGEWQVDCSGFAPGVYLYQITSNQNIVGKGKLVVE